ncbi:MAG: hypothetical protein RL754_321 [Bacteroidota bacterium]|jgi:GT2 family glycosyltransferase
MDLSIVIVNYNVKAFLSQCLDSIYASKTDFSYEVIVVDNASSDGSEDFISSHFPKVRWLANSTNVGFGRANNQGFDAARGTYTLILNPDTVLREDTIEKTLTYMHAHPEVGGLGIKGIDGSGNFLPESKRGLPTPLVALWKITGLSRIFPKSKIFARYHLGHLDPDKNHRVEILVGCFMLIPTNLLRAVGGFDPRYFMYGEDIDLSYELLKTGKENHYFAESEIIHYKGESTKRGSMNYVRMFYQAMILFAQKQFSGTSALAYKLLIYLGIYLRASLAVLARIAKSTMAPILDAGALLLALELFKNYWEQNHRYVDGGAYPTTYTYYIQGSYILLWIFGLWLSGIYHRNARTPVILRSMAITTLGIGFLYGLLPEDLRFSRALLLLGAAGGTTALFIWRLVLGILSGRTFFEKKSIRPRVLSIADIKESESIMNVVKSAGWQPAFEYTVQPPTDNQENSILELQKLVRLYGITDVIVSEKAFSNYAYMALLKALPNHVFTQRYLSELGLIVGSSSSTQTGNVLGVNHYKTADPSYLRQRRIADITAAILSWLLLPLFPIFYLMGKGHIYAAMLSKSGQLLLKNFTLVGYNAKISKEFRLPILPHPIFDISSQIPSELRNSQIEEALVTNYATQASLSTDLLKVWQWQQK